MNKRLDRSFGHFVEWLNRFADPATNLTSMMLASERQCGAMFFSPTGLLCEMYREAEGIGQWVDFDQEPNARKSGRLVFYFKDALFSDYAPLSVYQWAVVEPSWVMRVLEPAWAQAHCNLPKDEAVARVFRDVIRPKFMARA